MELDDPEAGLDEARENVLEDWPATSSPPTRAPGVAPTATSAAARAGPARRRALRAEHASAERAEAASDRRADAATRSRAAASVESSPWTHAHLAEPAEPVEHSAEHAPGSLAVPPGYAVLEGVPEGRRRTVGVVGVAVQRRGDDTAAAQRARRARARGRDRRTRSRSCPCRARSSCRSPRWRWRRRGASLPSSRSAASSAATRRTSTTSPPRRRQACSSPPSRPACRSPSALLTLDREEQAEQRIDKGAEAVRTALEMADLFANLRAASAS